MIAEEGATERHARDLGYLDKFLAKLGAEAEAMPGARGARLRALLGEEQARWGQIRQLLAGAEPASPPPASNSSLAPSQESLPAKAAGLTVGSLLGSPLPKSR